MSCDGVFFMALLLNISMRPEKRSTMDEAWRYVMTAISRYLNPSNHIIRLPAPCKVQVIDRGWCQAPQTVYK